MIAKFGLVDPEIIGLDLKKGKKLRKVKYIARSASLPSRVVAKRYTPANRVWMQT